jgi:hypothetical protein
MMIGSYFLLYWHMKNSMQEIVTKTRHLMEAAHTTLTGSELQVLTVECIWWHGNRCYFSRRFLYIENSLQRMESLANRLA